MFSLFCKDEKKEILKELDPQSAAKMSQTNKENYALIQDIYREKLKKEFFCQPPNNVSALHYSQELENEKNRLFDYLCIRNIYHSLTSKPTRSLNVMEIIIDRENFIKAASSNFTSIKTKLTELSTKYSIPDEMLKNWREQFDLILHDLLQAPTADDDTEFALINYLLLDALNFDPQIFPWLQKKMDGIGAPLSMPTQQYLDNATYTLEMLMGLSQLNCHELLKQIILKDKVIANVELGVRLNFSLLHNAISAGHVGMIKTLIELGANLNNDHSLMVNQSEKDLIGVYIPPPLYFVVDEFNYLLAEKLPVFKEIIAIFLEKGADTNIKVSSDGIKTPDITLQQACEELMHSDNPDVSSERKQLAKMICDYGQPEEANQNRLRPR